MAKETNVAQMPGVKAGAAKTGAGAGTKVQVQALPPLPKMPKAKKARPPKECGCGCGNMTKGGNFIPGHDARLHGWALRVERGVVKLADIPDGERQAVAKLMAAGKKVASPASDK